jgi:hypothetical protein
MPGKNECQGDKASREKERGKGKMKYFGESRLKVEKAHANNKTTKLKIKREPPKEKRLKKLCPSLRCRFECAAGVVLPRASETLDLDEGWRGWPMHGMLQSDHKLCSTRSM